MKPAPFTYHRPRSRAEVDVLLAEHGDEAKVLAGGQSLIPILNMRLATPGHLIDINHVAGEPTKPEEQGGLISTGPLVRHSAAECSALVMERAPLLREAIGHVAHPAIRSRGTVTGSIAHADPAAELPAVLAVLEGEVNARSTRGVRTISAQDFFAGPLENSLETDEWVDDVRWPVRAPDTGYAFEEFARRSGDYALCGVACTVRAVDGRYAVSLSYLGMGDAPIRLESEPFDEADLKDAVEDLVEGLDPGGDLHASEAFRMHLGRRLGFRAAVRAAAAAAADGSA